MGVVGAVALAQGGHAAPEVVAVAGGLAGLVMEELHVFGGHRRGLVGVAGIERGGEQLRIGLADLFAQAVGRGRGGGKAGGQQGQGWHGPPHPAAMLRRNRRWTR
ncbi:hypothetical protein G6F35_016852 [Rhizopus arrhizus]|nr:hypothetical protein G6F35_016852 [Rhizopus arrhizus]